jgi:HK97 family phage prohead protease
MQQLDRFYAEFRSEDAEAGDRFEGYAAVFGQYAKVRGRLETVSTRAFDRALTEKHDVRLLVNHDPNLVLARTKNGSLQLRTDEHGLHVTAELPDTTYSRDVKELMRRGVLDQMSFGFVVRSDSYDQIKGVQVRSVDDVDLRRLDRHHAGLSRHRGFPPFVGGVQHRVQPEQRRADTTASRPTPTSF